MDSRPVSRAASEGGPPRARPEPPPPTYLWEEVRRSRSRGGYPWTILDKGPLEDEGDADALISGSFLPLRMASSLPDDYPLHTHNQQRKTASEPAESIRSTASTEPELQSVRRSSASTYNSAMEGATGGRSPASFHLDEDILFDDGYGDELPDFVIEYFQTHSNALEEELPEHIVEFIQSKAAALERRRRLEHLPDVPELEETYTANEMRILRDAQRRLEQEGQFDKKVIQDEEDIPMMDDDEVVDADHHNVRSVRPKDFGMGAGDDDDFDQFFTRQESPEPQPVIAKAGKGKKVGIKEPPTKPSPEKDSAPKKKKFNLRSISMPPKPNIRMPNMSKKQLPKLKMPHFSLPGGKNKDKDNAAQEEHIEPRTVENKETTTSKGKNKPGKEKAPEKPQAKRTQSASPMRQKINSTFSSWQNSLRASFGKGKPAQQSDEAVNEFVEFSATPNKRSEEDHQYEEIQAPPVAAVIVLESAQGMPSVTVTQAPGSQGFDDEETEGIVEEPIDEDEDINRRQSPVFEEETMEGVENLPEAEEVQTDQETNEEVLDEEVTIVHQELDTEIGITMSEECEKPDLVEERVEEKLDEKPDTAQTLAAKLGAKSKSALQATTARSKQALQATKTKLDELSRDSLRKTRNTLNNLNKENLQATGKKLQTKFNDTLQKNKKKGKKNEQSYDSATLPKQTSPFIFESSTTPRKQRDYETSTPKVTAAPRRNRPKSVAISGNQPSLPIRKRRMNRHNEANENNATSNLHGSPRIQPSHSLPVDMNKENVCQDVVLRPRRRGKGPRFPTSQVADHRRHGVYNNSWQATYTQAPHRPQSAYFYSDMKNNALDELAELDYRSMSQELHHVFYAPVNTLAAVNGDASKKPERPSRSRNRKQTSDNRLSLQTGNEIPEYYNVPPRRPQRGPSTSSLQPSSVSLTGSRSLCSYDGDVSAHSSATTLLSTLLGQTEPPVPRRSKNKASQPLTESYQTWPRTKACTEESPVAPTAPKRTRSRISVPTVEYPLPEEIEEIEEIADYNNEITERNESSLAVEPETEPEIVPSAPHRKKRLSSCDATPAPIFEVMTWPRAKRTPPPTAPKREKKPRQSQVSLQTPTPSEDIHENEPKVINELILQTEESVVKESPPSSQSEEQEAIQMIDDVVNQELEADLNTETPPIVEDPYATIEPRNREKPPRPPPPVIPPSVIEPAYNASTTGMPYDYIYAVPRRQQRPSELAASPHTLPHPPRPPRAYWTIRPQRPPRRKTTIDFLDLEADLCNRSADHSENSERHNFMGSARDLQSAPVIERMRFRPLPAPPRSKRGKSKESNERSNYSDELEPIPVVPTPPKPPRRTGSLRKSPKSIQKRLPPNIPPATVTVPEVEIRATEEDGVASQENALESRVELSSGSDGYEPIEVDDDSLPKVEEVSIATQTDPIPEFDDDLLAASLDFGDELPTETLPEDVTPASPTPAKKVDQESQWQTSDRTETSRTAPTTKEPEEKCKKSLTPTISKPPPCFHRLRTPPRTEDDDDETPSWPPYPFSFPPLNVNLPDRLHLTELEVDRLNVRELQANRLVVSAIDTLTLQVSELTSTTGPFVISLPQPAPPPPPTEERRPMLAITEATQTSFDVVPAVVALVQETPVCVKSDVAAEDRHPEAKPQEIPALPPTAEEPTTAEEPPTAEEPELEELGAVGPAPVPTTLQCDPTIPELTAQLAVLSARELSRVTAIASQQAQEVAGRFAHHVWQQLTDLLERQGIHLSPKEQEGVQVLLLLLLVVVVCIFLLLGSRVPGQRWEIYYPY